MTEPGRYTIGRKIAEGGMAEIYLGTQHGAAGFVRPVVVKRIHAVFSANPQFRNMFIDEAHIAMSLNHGNIVQVLDLGVAAGRYFLILELVDGWDLNHILTRAEAAGMQFPLELALFVAAEIGRALAYAHGREHDGKPLAIVHRDVSPHNALVSEQGEVKLSDFGIATAENRREQTLAGTVKGKIGFMSPEQASGKPLDARSDIFSLGATLYLMATGRRPFAARSDLEALLRTQAADFPAPDTAAPDLPPAVAAIITRAMSKDPADRYQSADEMVLDLERVQRSELRPAGKTELKAWLATLAARDQEPSTSRAAAFAPDGETGETSLDGSIIVLGESDLEPAGPLTAAGVERPAVRLRPGAAAGSGSAAATSEAAPPGAAAAAAPAGPAAAPPATSPTPPAVTRAASASRPADPFAEIPPTLPVDTSGGPLPPPRPAWGRRIAILAVVAAAVAGAAYLALRPPVDAVTPTAEPPPASRPVAHAPGADAAPAEAAAPASAPASQAAASQPASSSQPASAVAVDDQVPETEATPEEGKAPPRRPSARKHTMVSVKLVTRPPGARVRVAKRVFGVTPRSLKFRSGLTYVLTFEKEGYVSVRRRVHVSSRRHQTIYARLPKAKRKKGWWQW